MSATSREAFLKLIRLGIGLKEKSFPDNVDWEDIEALATQHGLLAVVADGVELLPDASRPAKALLLQWIGEELQGEQTYKLHQEFSADMANLFHRNGIRTYVLKGRIVAECYPKPCHRVSADVDCYLLSEKGHDSAWDKGNSLIKTKGHEVGTDFYKNSTFYLPGLMVENHRFLTPFRGNKKLKALETVLQALLEEDKGEDKFEGTWLYRPPVTVSALFLIEHAYSHFLHEGLTWRMVLDWMMFSKKHEKEIKWSDFDVLVEEFGFKRFYDSFVRIGKYLLGELVEEDLTKVDRRMLADVWAPLDLHETLTGVKAKFQLAGNYWRARWKYKYFTDMTWVRALFEWVSGAVFDKNPKLN